MLRLGRRISPHRSRPGAHRQSVPRGLHHRQHWHLRKPPPPRKNLLTLLSSSCPLFPLSVLCVKFFQFAPNDRHRPSLRLHSRSSPPLSQTQTLASRRNQANASQNRPTESQAERLHHRPPRTSSCSSQKIRSRTLRPSRPQRPSRPRPAPRHPHLP